MDIALRSGRERRKPRGRAGQAGARIVAMTSIDDRPQEVEGRKVPGHWEGDLVVGKQGKTAMGTLVERKTRYFVPVALPDGRDSGAVREAIIKSVEGIPAHLRKSITWDQGSEMAQHAALTLATDIPVYFAHAHSPWNTARTRTPTGSSANTSRKGQKSLLNLPIFGKSPTN